MQPTRRASRRRGVSTPGLRVRRCVAVAAAAAVVILKMSVPCALLLGFQQEYFPVVFCRRQPEHICRDFLWQCETAPW
jgi:hypothetical protein